jgi:hypothetical protein
MSDLQIPRKWKLRVGDEHHNVFARGMNENAEHVIMKALLWALYLPHYPEIIVEVKIGDRYKPDLIAFDAHHTPRFWGEAGRVGAAKIRSIARRYSDTHFAIARWNMNLDPLVMHVQKQLKSVRRNAPFDLLRFPVDSKERFIDERGYISISFSDIEWERLTP